MEYSLRSYQNEGVDFIREKKKVALFFSMGLGKTLTVLHALEPEMLPCLIVAPLRVAKYVWPDEIEKFGFPYSYSFVHGPKKHERLNEITDIKIINPEGLHYLHQRCLDAGRVPFRTVIVDESSLFKNVKSKRWKYLRGLIDAVPYRILLTGTPGVHHDLFGQMSLLGNVFGEYREFLMRYFEFDYFGRPLPKYGASEAIENRIQHLVLRKDVSKELDLPPITENTIRFSLNDEEQDTYDNIECGIEQVSENTYTPLRCACSGFIYEHDDFGGQRARRFGNTKINLLSELVDDNAGENFLVVTNFREERKMICEAFRCPFIDGETKPHEEAVAIQAWNEGSLPMLVMHPRSLGHGVRLESGGRQIVWYSLPDSGELYEQTNARIWRSGQEKPVLVHKLVSENTIESTIENLLRRKVLTAQSLLAAMREKLDAKSDAS